MNQSVALHRERAAVPAAEGVRPLHADDKAMLKAAANLTRDLNVARPAVYWADMLGSALLGYGAMAATIAVSPSWIALLTGLVSILAMYRAGSFIHEITHVKPNAVPGFYWAWNALVGIPMMIPSFMYEGVHNQHHAKTYYGTAEDPEYLPLALMHPWTLPLFLVAAALAPIGVLIRFGVLAPLSLLSAKLREIVVARYSGLQINPRFRRPFPTGDFKRRWMIQEVAASLWAITLIALVVTGIVPLSAFLVFLAISSGVMFLNQIRTLVAHLWENDGEPMSVTEQYLDSVNVPPPGILPALWAPVGLRYHALHHLLPGLPYHALGEAHRRISAALEQESPYYHANYRGLTPLVTRLAISSWRGR